MQDGSRVAAFFDLDRTVVPDAVGMYLVSGLIDAGLIEGRERTLAQVARPINAVLRGMYRRFGENWLSVQFSRRGIKGLAGRPADRLREAAQFITDRIEKSVFAEARWLIQEHKRQGHTVVIASSGWRDVVEPLAGRLGVDHVLATEFEVKDGKFTGEFVGRWLFGRAKRDAVRELAREHGIDLSESFAYSDSFYDAALLEEVGRPRAVNPDPILRVVAAVNGWPVYEFRGREGTPRPAVELFDVVKPILHPALLPVRVEVAGLENIPKEGAVIVACNHRSYLDGPVIAALGSWRGRKLRFLGKREIFDAPVLGHLARAGGQIPVDRGTGSIKPLREALDALDRGEAVAILPQGTIPRGLDFFDPVLKGRPGVARLAVESGAPVVPVALWDTERVWPRKARLPNVRPWLPGAPWRPVVHARVGEPIFLKAPAGKEDDKETLDGLVRQLMERIAGMLPEEVRSARPPLSGEEIAQLKPPSASFVEDLLALPGRALEAPGRLLRGLRGRSPGAPAED